MRHLPLVIVGLAVVGVVVSCREDRHDYVPNASDVERVPTMSTRDVETFISDSGYTRYHISTPLWEMYDEAAEPHWRFPDGLELQQYDEQLRPAANVSCDSATYLSRRRLWQLDGHVVMVNTLRDSFLTQQLFWDQYNSRVYSDSFIHIVRSDRIIEGYGFESNQNMTAYTVQRPTGIIPVERPARQADGGLQSDSTYDMQPGNRRRYSPVRASERRYTVTYN
ncbi:MAG: LPS export ABC transporter periplasmic protein LptC [Bacteroidales bacterium]|nr:LPS export ABC transporter periplasmic protein LptC [Bacteroidales bacterium]